MVIEEGTETLPEALVANVARWAAGAGDDPALRALHDLRAEIEVCNYLILQEEGTARFGDLLARTAFGRFAEVARLPLSAIAPVLTHPVGTVWVRATLDAVRRGDEDTVREQAEAFAPLHVACHVRARVGTTMSAELPRTFSFPGLGALMDMDGPAAVELSVEGGGDGARVRARRGARTVEFRLEGGRAVAAEDGGGAVLFPRLECGDLAIEHVEPVLRGLFPLVADSDNGYDLPAWRERIGASLNLLEACWPEMHAELRAGVRVIVPTSKAATDRHSTGSDLAAWRAVNTTLVEEPWLTDGIIHEHRHDLLNSLSLLDDLFTPGAMQREDLYSPWRPEPRPPVGLFHAIFVFVAVGTFYTRLLVTPQLPVPVDREAVRDALGLQTLNLLNGIEELRAGAHLSAFGERLLDALDAAAHSLHAAALEWDAFRSGTAARLAGSHHAAWRERWGLPTRALVEANIRLYAHA